ncbi:MAG: hypothetical protein R3320_10120 [Nitriliruptorales bacterium]|nr:hypothetical protein [Nitriliruptorales bacterium]
MTGDPSPTTQVALGPIDRQHLADARRWIHRDASLTDRILGGVSDNSRQLIDAVLDRSGARRTMQRVAAELLDNFEPVVSGGPPAAMTPQMEPEQRARALAHADRDADQIASRYIGGLSVQGAATGAASVNPLAAIAAVAADVTITTLGLLRASSEIISTYIHRDDLREASIATVLLAGEQDVDTRRRGLLITAGIEPAAQPSEDRLAAILAEQAGPRLVNEAMESLVRRRVRQRALAAVPLFGAALGAATSAWMVERACTVARHVGRLSAIHADVTLERTVLD